MQGLGLQLGEDGPDGLNLSHEWVARFGGGFRAGRVSLAEEFVPAWLRGEDIPATPPPACRSGGWWRSLTPQGRLLGRGKIQANRLKNLLPRRLF